MPIRREQLELNQRMKLELLSKPDQVKVLNAKNIDEAKAMLDAMKESIRLERENYEPKLQISGSATQYHNKNVFTEIFDKQDVQDFMTLAELSDGMEDEVIAGELNRKINEMHKDGKQPLQCMVYATKQNEKVFYNNEKKVTVWAKVIADTVNSNTEYIRSINHMLVNWGIWKSQIIMLITACEYMKQNEKLDEVIRDLYINYDDDKVRFTVIKRLLHGFNKENYQYAFAILKNADFIESDTERKYYNILKRKVEEASLEEKEALYDAFRGTQGFSGKKRVKLENLFVVPSESKLIKKINESNPKQKEEILKMIWGKIYGNQKEYREIAFNVKDIKQYRIEIQEMFMKKLEKIDVSLEDIRICGLAIGNLDMEGKALPFIEEQMSLYNDEEKTIMFLYVLAALSDQYINKFTEAVLNYSYYGTNAQALFSSVRNLNRPRKNQEIRQYLYENCLKIKDNKGIDSREFKIALRNLGTFLQGGLTMAIYDVKFDELLFEFLGYNKAEGVFDKSCCTVRNVAVVLGVLENVMDKKNYEGRYMKFMGDLFVYFRDINPNTDLLKRIDKTVKDLTGQGIPSL